MWFSSKTTAIVELYLPIRRSRWETHFVNLPETRWIVDFTPAQMKENTRWKIKPWPLYGLMLRHSLQQVVTVHHIEAFLIIWHGHTGDDKRIRLGYPKQLSLLVHRNQSTLGGPLFKCSVHPLPTSSTNLHDISITNEQEHNLENPCETARPHLLVILQRNPYYLIVCSSRATKRAQNSKVPKPEQQRITLDGG